MRAKEDDQGFIKLNPLELQHESSLSKQDLIKDFSSPMDSSVEKQPSYANKDHNSIMQKDIVLKDSKVTEDAFIVQNSTIMLVNNED